METTRLLTKTLFRRACQCPKKLLDLPIAESANKVLQSLAQDGQKIGSYSRLLYPNGVEVVALENAVADTNHLLKSNSVTLFEAAIRFDNYFIRADILNKENDTLNLVEVKMKSWDGRSSRLTTKTGNVRAEFMPYINDVAFQKWVLQQAHPTSKITSSLVFPDKSKVNTIPNLGGLFEDDFSLSEASKATILCNGHELLVTKIDVTALVEQVLESELKFPGSKGDNFVQVASGWEAILRKEQEVPAVPLGSHCRDCEFRSYCWKDKSENSVLDLYYGGKTINKLIEKGTYSLSGVTPFDLGLNEDDKRTNTKKKSGMSRPERQWYQVRKDQELVLDRDFLANQMKEWEFPWHCVDFETISPVLPYFVDRAPFEVGAFQFSHHTIDEDGRVEHVSEFLHAEPGICPNKPFLDALETAFCDTRGSIFRWGAHENTVLSAVLKSERNDSVVLHSLLKGGDSSMVDLMQVVSKAYYVPKSDASCSIKKILQPTLQHSQLLRELYSGGNYSGKNFRDMQWWKRDSEGNPVDPYSLLAGDSKESVAHGGDAMVAYNLLQKANLESGIREATRKQLLRYCELDTLAMVMILQGLQDFLQRPSGACGVEPNQVVSVNEMHVNSSSSREQKQ